jgi:hypothetical protein
MRPIPEGRARALIARTFRDAGLGADLDRTVQIGHVGKVLRLEVAAVGHKFGVAYLTLDEWARLGDAVPTRQQGDTLVVVTGEGGVRVLCTFAENYAEDDATGDDRTATTIAADRRLERDVRDFLHRAAQKEWP